MHKHNKATFIRDVSGDFTGTAHLYKIDPPVPFTHGEWVADEYVHDVRKTEYVIVSAIVAPFGGGPETYIFPATDEGEVISWIELEGSYKGGLSIVTALENAGYELEEVTGGHDVSE